ncbi:aldose 1-epimerase family protein [Pseudolysinimonas kribbensis]|uniref:aldose 1-epimerase family protein n=1 Tax=Pseudolysinimonas kribbensis TaxID=433641 RepID=UPI0031D0538E
MTAPAIPRIALEHGAARAQVSPLGAALCSLTVDGRELTEPVPATAIAPQGNGLVLAPWPNRVRDGRWTHDGVVQQLAITEPAYGNASHGLLRNTAYRVVERTASTLELGALIVPQPGWPFTLETRVTYRLDDDGVTVTHRAVNGSDASAPWAVGAHPYLRSGAHPVEQLELAVAATAWLDKDERLNALGIHPIDAEHDLHRPTALAGIDANTAYTGLANGDATGPIAELRAPDGGRTVLWADPAFGWLQVYTPRDHPRPDGTGLAVALEPMTAPPDALNSRLGLAHLAPGAEWSASWGIRAA